MLSELTAFGPSRELAAAIQPMADARHVSLLQDQTDEAVRLLDDQAQASIGGARDVRAPIGRARRGGRLTAMELLDVAETARAAELFGARLAGWKAPHLAELRDELDPAPALRERIERSVDESGEVLDTASADLAAIRKRLRTAQDRVRERLNAMLHSADLAGVIGEAIVTLRSGRYVIPIRAEAKGRVKGIVHDQSASGATLFVEPLGVVELNNTWTQAGLDAAREEERILDELSRDVESRAESLLASLAALARADLWLARARLAAQMDAVRPAVVDDAAELLSARHPLLGQGAVPIDLRLGERFGYRALVVTGPNTGGKTVSLKTLGLLALMHQAGLRVPAADGARLPAFGRVMADIGDEQSIAQSLSTFSSHLRNVVRFVAAAGHEHAGAAGRGRRRDRSHGRLRAGHGGGRAAARTGCLGGRDHPLRGAQGVRPGAPAGQQRVGGIRRGHAAADLSARDRPAGQVTGLRHRRAPGSARADPGRCSLTPGGRAREHGGDAGGPGGGAGGADRRAGGGAQRPRDSGGGARSGEERRGARPAGGGADPGRCETRGGRPPGSHRARGGRCPARADAATQPDRRSPCRRSSGCRAGDGPAVDRPGTHAQLRRCHRSGRRRRRGRGISAAEGRPVWPQPHAGQQRSHRRDQRSHRPRHAADRRGAAGRAVR